MFWKTSLVQPLSKVPVLCGRRSSECTDLLGRVGEDFGAALRSRCKNNIHQSLKDNPWHDAKTILIMSLLSDWGDAEWNVPETNPTLSARRVSEGGLSVQPNKHSLWWKRQIWHRCHVWLTCASLANDWIVNETYPSREGWASDKSGFVITAGAVITSKGLLTERVSAFVRANLLPHGALHLPVTSSYLQGFCSPLPLSVIGLFKREDLLW